jgi:hypothetical protein
MCVSGGDQEGNFYAGLWIDGRPCWVDPSGKLHGLRMRGPGLASAYRALTRRGYQVERVPA